MKHQLVRISAVTAVMACGAGCASDEDSNVSRRTDGDCVDAWNANDNAANRATAAAELQGWALEVSRSRARDPGEGLTGHGCAYFFYSSSQWTSIRGMWETDGDLRWGVPPTASGSMEGAQGTRRPNAVLRPDGTIARR